MPHMVGYDLPRLNTCRRLRIKDDFDETTCAWPANIPTSTRLDFRLQVSVCGWCDAGNAYAVHLNGCRIEDGEVLTTKLFFAPTSKMC